MEEHAFPIKHLEDALAYRKAVIRAFKSTAASTEPLVKNDPRLTFVIIGGGITGTELAGEMVDFCDDLCKHFPNLRSYYRVVLIEGSEHLLSQLGKANGEYVKSELRAKNVAVLTSTRVGRVEPGKIHLTNGKMVKGTVIAWSGGVMAPPLLKESGFETMPDGRIRTTPYLRTIQFPDVYAIGDCAYILDPQNGKPILQTGQYAELQGAYLAESFQAEMRGMKPTTYSPFSLGISISLGRHEALTLSGPLRLTGIPGRIAKDVSYGKHEIQIRSRSLLVG
jgi:NADH dehydrogenase